MQSSFLLQPSAFRLPAPARHQSWETASRKCCVIPSEGSRGNSRLKRTLLRPSFSRPGKARFPGRTFLSQKQASKRSLFLVAQAHGIDGHAATSVLPRKSSHNHSVEPSTDVTQGEEQEGALPPPSLKDNALPLVETAFMASFSCVLYTLSRVAGSVLPIQNLCSLFFPLPIAIIYLRWNMRQAFFCAFISSLLLLCTLGTPFALGYILNVGIMGLILGFLWKNQFPWILSMLISTAVRVWGLLAQIQVFSLFLGEDIWGYLLNQVSSLAAALRGSVGLAAQGAAATTPSSLVGIVYGILVANAMSYTFCVHIIGYLAMRRLLRFQMPRPPSWLIKTATGSSG